MYRTLLTAVMMTLALSPAQAGIMGVGRSNFDGFGLHRGGFFGAGLAGQSWQTRFEDRFDDLMADYELGLA